jgi:hypothetical protein
MAVDITPKDKSPIDAPPFAVLMVLADRDREIERAADVLESLFTYEPGVRWVILVDDAIKDRNLATKFAVPATCKVVSLMNPGKGRGNGWRGRLTVGVMLGLKWAAENTDARFLLKLDTDSLVIAPFAEKVAGALDTDPRLGLLGSYSRYPDGPREDTLYWAPLIEKMHRRVAIYRHLCPSGTPIQVGYFGACGKLRKTIHRALLNGYHLGECCQGGGYAVSGAALKQAVVSGILQNPLIWLRTPLCEDVAMGIVIRSVGLRMQDFNGDGEPFGVKFEGLPDDPSRLIERGFSIIHSIKTFGQREEPTNRAFFQDVRKKKLSKNAGATTT